MLDTDQTGSFYLGRRYDLAKRSPLPEPLLYGSKDLTTHAVCVGMTGSGKTGLCLSLLEEAALDGIPAIAIDPKGDLGNLLLAFPDLEPGDFRPWVDPSEAARKQLSLDEFAAAQATLWRNGLADWGQGPDRIRRYCNATERVIYTPGSSAGIPITVLDSFHAPPPELLADAEAYADRIASAASGLLSLVGMDADPVRSREHIFLANVLDQSWRAGESLDLMQLIRYIQRPPMERIGALDVESIFPAKDRSKLAMSLNNLLASPSFASWLDGVPLDVGRMLYTPEGRPRLAIVSIAHLNDAERMFFVTILLNEVLSWIRTQPGTSSLRALLYMDEVFGYFPPSANPPSKRPMLTLLKQARAFGLGCVLATQNPVDLDYKGLSNAGTWLLGRLQTERDKARVIEGLEGASTEAGSNFDRRAMEATLAALGSRVFLMNNVHDDAPVVFHTRWAMSYLCGPLAREQIKRLMDPMRSAFPPASGAAMRGAAVDSDIENVAAAASIGAANARDRPILPASIPEEFAAIIKRVPDDFRLEYRPALAGTGKVHFRQMSHQIDVWRPCRLLTTMEGATADDVWRGAADWPTEFALESEPDDRGQFSELPNELVREKSYHIFARQLTDHLYREQTLALWQCESLEACSREGETQVQFRDRLAPLAAEQHRVERDAVANRYAAKIADADAALQRHRNRLRTERWQFIGKLANILWVIVETVLRAIGRGRRGRPRSPEVAFRQAASEHGQQANAKISAQNALQEKQRLEKELQDKLLELEKGFEPSNLQIETLQLRPLKSDVAVDQVTLVWLPWRVDAAGRAEPVY